MKNENDYQAGWTQQTTNPATGKKCSGGAARNLKIARVGGANSLQVATVTQTLQSIQPIVDAQQAQIQQQQTQIEVLTKTLQKVIKTIEKNGKK